MSSISSCMRFGRVLIGSTQFLRNPFQEGIRCVSSPSGHFRLNSTTAAKEETKSETSNNASSEPSPPPDPKAKAADASQPPSPSPQLDEINKALEEMKKQRDEFSDKYKRALADSENLRKRLTKQIEDAKIYGIQSFCKDLIEVADILGKATECVPKEEVKDSNPHLKNLYEGLTMTEAQLHKVFQRHGLSPVNPLDEKFNPNFHEALFQQEVEGKAAGTVVVVSKIGYKLHERVVRPALVGVAKG